MSTGPLGPHEPRVSFHVYRVPSLPSPRALLTHQHAIAASADDGDGAPENGSSVDSS